MQSQSNFPVFISTPFFPSRGTLSSVWLPWFLNERVPRQKRLLVNREIVSCGKGFAFLLSDRLSERKRLFALTVHRSLFDSCHSSRVRRICQSCQACHPLLEPGAVFGDVLFFSRSSIFRLHPLNLSGEALRLSFEFFVSSMPKGSLAWLPIQYLAISTRRSAPRSCGRHLHDAPCVLSGLRNTHLYLLRSTRRDGTALVTNALPSDPW